MSRLYTVREFATLSGVTPKALRHYDQLGLLKPRRSDAGYRQYVERDLERLEQITALMFVGLSLRDIRRVLEKPAPALADALRAQRAVLEEKRRLIAMAVEAIRDAEQVIAEGKAPAATVLTRLIEVIDMQRHTDRLRQYFSDEAWTRWTALREAHPQPGSLSAAWRTLFGDAASLIGTDPSSPASQAFGARWLRLWEETTGGDDAVLAGLRGAWADRASWPPEMREAASGIETAPVAGFIRVVLADWIKRYYTEDAWAKKQALKRPETDAQWAELVREVQAVLSEDPTTDKGQALADRWCRLVFETTGADPEVIAGMRRAWADRDHWPLPMRPRNADVLAAVSTWIAQAIAERQKRAGQSGKGL
jgi:DNA-binding transcriptional MerR regulator